MINRIVYRIIQRLGTWLIRKEPEYKVLQRDYFLCDVAWVIANDLTRPTLRIPVNGVEWHFHCCGQFGWIGVRPNPPLAILASSYSELQQRIDEPEVRSEVNG